MSNPWEAEEADPTGDSGLGCEFAFESSVQGEWAIRRLWHVMAYQVLLCHNRYPGGEPLGAYDRLPLRSPIWDRDSEVQSLMLTPAESCWGVQQVESGMFDLISVVGLTDTEAAFACAHGGDLLVPLLRSGGAFPVTDPTRSCVDLSNGASA